MSQRRAHNDLRGIRVAVASGSLRHRDYLQQVFDRIGLRVILNEPFSDLFISKLNQQQADVVLLDIEEHNERHDRLLNKLLETNDTPIIFNDISVLTLNEPVQQGKWFTTLMGKIAEITGHPEWHEADLELARHPLRRPDATGTQRELARRVWVLGASLGGPEAVKRFLAALPGEVPTAFVLAQHLGANFDGLLAQQLDRVTALQVRTARAGHTLHHSEVIVVPVNQRLHINPLGVIELHPLAAPSFYTPSIDTVITDMARRYGRASGAIVFSGMCDDGIMGVRVMQALGGPVWVQDAESCVISAMPDNIRRTGTVSYTGAPEQLAAKLLEYLQI